MFTLQNQSVCVGKRVAAPSEMRISDGCQKTQKKKKNGRRPMQQRRAKHKTVLVHWVWGGRFSVGERKYPVSIESISL